MMQSCDNWLCAVALFFITPLSAALLLFHLRNEKLESSSNRRRWKDILPAILEKSAPVAAADELNEQGEDAATCERLLGGRQLIISADAAVADYVFRGPARDNYVRRPADDGGLAALGMLNRGLIWNNEVDLWRVVRGCFQRALGERALGGAVAVAREECAKLLFQATEEGAASKAFPINLLDLSRQVTFRATLHVFFGLKSSEFQEHGIDEKAFIAAIVAYFKAWEYFLFRARAVDGTQLKKTNLKAVEELRRHVNRLLQATSKNMPRNSSLFIDDLCNACEKEVEPELLLEQSALEMLLAGTDTSSVTAYYGLLGLAGDAKLQNELRDELQSGVSSEGKKHSPMLKSIIDETLRFKPVGPVVLREAVAADPNFPAAPVKPGAAVLIHLAEMNLRQEYWHDPRTYNPKRFLGQAIKSKNFFPFGDGPKGCIGMHLGRREVGAILEEVVLRYEMSVEGSETLGSLRTHWDIANQPDDPVRICVTPLHLNRDQF